MDDEEGGLASRRRQLREIVPEYKVGLSKSGDEALALMERARETGQPVPRVISDQLMPGMLGDKRLATIAERYPQTVQLMLTGPASPEAIGRAVNHGRLVCFLSKPSLLQDLQFSVRAALQSYENERRVKEQSQALQSDYDRSLSFVREQDLKRFGRQRLEEVQRDDTCATNVTEMFADTRSFTSIIERLTPEESFSMVNEYCLATEAAIRNNRGFIDHDRGDGTMALFPDDPVHLQCHPRGTRSGTARHRDCDSTRRGHRRRVWQRPHPAMRGHRRRGQHGGASLPAGPTSAAPPGRSKRTLSSPQGRLTQSASTASRAAFASFATTSRFGEG